MKTAKAVFGILTITLALVPVAANAQFNYVTNGDAITITGYTGPGGDVIIPSSTNGLPVTSIGDGAFSNCTNLTGVTIPNSVTSIEVWAFSECHGLTSVIIPNSVTNIGGWVFQDCLSLTNATIGTNVITIGECEFCGCNSLASVTIPNSVTSIGRDAFNSCTSLTSVTIGTNVTSIGLDAFDHCLSLPSVTIPNSVTSIGGGAFAYCFSLTSVTIPDSVTSVSNYTFYACTSLTNVTIGKSVTNIGSWAFFECTSLTRAYFQGSAPSLVGTEAFGPNPITVYCYPAATECTLGPTGWGSTFAGAPVVVLTPVSTPPSITTEPQDVLVNAHDSTSFHITATGTPPFSYQWSQNSSNILNATYCILTITNVKQSHLGAYTVLVTNSYGSVTSLVADLTMYPFLASPFSGLVTYWGRTNTLSVGAWGTAALSYQWFKDGAAIDNGTNETLTLSSIQFTNAGLYSVVVSSALGSVTNAPYQVVVNPANISIRLCPDVVIEGTAGYSYIIQCATDLGETNSWETLTNLTLTQPIQYWDDISADATHGCRFYRVLPGQ